MDLEGEAKAMIAALDNEKNPCQKFQTIDTDASLT